MGVVSQGQLKIMSFIKSVASTGPGRVLRFAAARRSSARFLSSSSTRASGKVYEFRTYAVHPARMKECMGVMEDLMPVRTVFSKLNGCWYTELGGLNEVNFLWEYGMLLVPRWKLAVIQERVERESVEPIRNTVGKVT